MKKRRLILALCCATVISLTGCGFHYKVTVNGKDIVSVEETTKEKKSKEETEESSKNKFEKTEEDTKEIETVKETKSEEVATIDIGRDEYEGSELIKSAFDKLNNESAYILYLNAKTDYYNTSETDIWTGVEINNDTVVVKDASLGIQTIYGNINGEHNSLESVVLTSKQDGTWVQLANNEGKKLESDVTAGDLGVSDTLTSTDVQLYGVKNPDILKVYTEDNEYIIEAENTSLGMNEIEYVINKDGYILEISYKKDKNNESGLYEFYYEFQDDFKDKSNYMKDAFINSDTYLGDVMATQLFGEEPKIETEAETEEEFTIETYQAAEGYSYEKDYLVKEELDNALGQKLRTMEYKNFSLDIPSYRDYAPGETVVLRGYYTVYPSGSDPIKREMELKATNREGEDTIYSNLTLMEYSIE